MKFTVIRKDKKNRLHVSLKTVNVVMEQMVADNEKGDVAGLRQWLLTSSKIMPYQFLHRLPVIYPMAELAPDANNNLIMQQMNGVVMLNVSSQHDPKVLWHLKQKAMTMPTTLAAFVGSSGESLKVLVCVGRPDGTLPQTEEDANRLLAAAFQLVKTPYQALLGVAVDDVVPTVKTAFRTTCDERLMYNAQAVPFMVDEQLEASPLQNTKGEQQQYDYDLYDHYEYVYKQAVDKVWERVPEDIDAESFLVELARELCLAGLPEEESVTHIWTHHQFKTPQPYSEEHIRAVVAAVFAESKPGRNRQTGGAKTGLETRQLLDYLQQRYVFRYNTIMGYTEYRPNTTWMQDWQPVDERVVNGITTDCRLAGLNTWDKDVQRFVRSDKVRQFNPIEDYLWQVHDKWDGEDHIGRLAKTVPTDHPYWQQWFRTWLLAMVAQWRHLNPRYGNSVAPLLISQQGYNKSTFCRLLLPEELQWGFIDNLSLDEKRPVLQAMSQMLLINLDEFNQISPRIQQGFLKNVIQLARVKARRPYGKHTEDFPRLASFIATTNMADVLADPSGCRRFIGVELTGPIDVSVRPNHEQIYAQAQELIDRGEPYWFDERQTELLMQQNRRFQLLPPAEQYFFELFQPADNEREGEWMTAAAIFQCVRKSAGAAVKQSNLVTFGRMLSHVENLLRRRSINGTEYLLMRK